MRTSKNPTSATSTNSCPENPWVSNPRKPPLTAVRACRASPKQALLVASGNQGHCNWNLVINWTAKDLSLTNEVSSKAKRFKCLEVGFTSFSTCFLKCGLRMAVPATSKAAKFCSHKRKPGKLALFTAWTFGDLKPMSQQTRISKNLSPSNGWSLQLFLK